MPAIIEFSHVTKTFKLPHEKRNNLREHFFGVFRGREYEIIKAADDLSFSVEEGEFLGIMGPNGAGKSTLLKLIAGVLHPDSGNIQVGGRISPFLELGVGFHPELSGKDNVFLYGAILGLSRKGVMRRYGDIVGFAELEKYMDQKVKNYSTGMQMRLAFSITAHVDADILLVDEALAVGDESFQQRCLSRMTAMKKDGKTIIVVSHNHDQINKHCERVLHFSGGRIVTAKDMQVSDTQY